jgi:hypothetical protein
MPILGAYYWDMLAPLAAREAPGAATCRQKRCTEYYMITRWMLPRIMPEIMRRDNGSQRYLVRCPKAASALFGIRVLRYLGPMTMHYPLYIPKLKVHYPCMV